MTGGQRFCPHCGQTHPAAAVFCPATGAALPPVKARGFRFPLALGVFTLGALLVVAGLWIAWLSAPGKVLDLLSPDRTPTRQPAVAQPATPALPQPIQPTAMEPTAVVVQPVEPTAPLPAATTPAVATQAGTCGQPTGRIFYNCGSRTEQSEICAIRPDGSGREQLTAYGGATLYPSPALDGGSLVFVSNKDGGKGLYRMDLNSGQVTAVLDENNAFGLYIGLPAYSPDGWEIAFTANDGQVKLYRINADGSSLRSVQQTSALNQAWLADWSPDGSRLLFTYGTYSNDASLGIADLNGSGYETLAGVSHLNSRPDWGADGRILISDNQGVAILDPRSGQLERVISGGDNRSATFSPDGCQAVLYRCTGGNGSGCSLFVLDLATRALTRLKGTEDGWSPRWGP